MAAINRARSPAQVGRPNWSATMRNGPPARARRKMVRTKLLPCALKTQLVRRIQWRGQIDRAASSPANLLAP